MTRAETAVFVSPVHARNALALLEKDIGLYGDTLTKEKRT